jgi:hypothetical protein
MEAGKRHHQVVSIDQAVSCGLDPTTLRRRARTERWQRLHPGVFALPGSSFTHERQTSAALLAIGGKVAACRHTAAYLWGIIDQAPTHVDVLIPPNRRAPDLAGVHALRSRTVLPSDLGHARDLVVTTPERTICDLAAVTRDAYDLRALVLSAVERGVLDLGRLHARHAQLRRSPGAPRLARVLHDLDRQRPGSTFSHEIRVFVRSRGLVPYPQPLWVPCHDGRTRRIDIPFIDQRVGVEASGGSHLDQGRISLPDQDDMDVTDLELAAVGWRITRVTRRRFDHDRERWLDGLLRLLRTPPPRV